MEKAERKAMFKSALAANEYEIGLLTLSLAILKTEAAREIGDTAIFEEGMTRLLAAAQASIGQIHRNGSDNAKALLNDYRDFLVRQSNTGDSSRGAEEGSEGSSPSAQ